MKRNKAVILAGLATWAMLGVAHAVTGEEIFKFDFTGGTAGAEAFKYTLPDPNVTISTNMIYDHIATWTRGGSADTVRWKYNLDGESIYSTDLHTETP